MQNWFSSFPDEKKNIVLKALLVSCQRVLSSFTIIKSPPPGICNAYALVSALADLVYGFITKTKIYCIQADFILKKLFKQILEKGL